MGTCRRRKRSSSPLLPDRIGLGTPNLHQVRVAFGFSPDGSPMSVCWLTISMSKADGCKWPIEKTMPVIARAALFGGLPRCWGLAPVSETNKAQPTPALGTL